MRAQIRHISVYVLVVFLILFVWSIGIASAQKIESLQGSIELRYTNPTLTLEQIRKIQESESVHEQPLITQLTGWQQVDHVDIENKELKKSTKATMLYVFGDTKGLVGKNQIIGDFLYSGDWQGAMITSKLAYDLWGNLDVINKTFDYDGHTYQVRGIIDKNEPAVIMQLCKELKEPMQMSQLRVEFIDTENIIGQLETFRMRYGLEDSIAINLSLISILWNQLIYMPMWIIGIWGLIKLYRLLYRTYRYWVAALILIGIIGIVTWILLRFMTISIHIPSYLIPNQWSDFEFWSKLWNNLRTNHLAIEGLPKYLPDIWREENLKRIMGTWLISSGMTIWAISKTTIRDRRELFWKVLLAISLSCIVIIINDTFDIVAVMPKAFWVGIPLFMAICYLCDKWIKLLES